MRVLGLFFLSFLSHAGLIYPKTSRPVLLSRNNYKSYADYTFFYQITSYIPTDAILEITFPTTSFDSGLGISTCSCLNWNSITLPCTVTDTKVALQVGELSNADSNNTYNITIYSVKNPSVGGTTMFQIQIRAGINVLDYSDFFANIGIVPALTSITSASVACITNCIAGLTSTYTLTYTTSEDYEVGSRIFIKFPEKLTFPSTVSCTSAEVVGISCMVNKNLVSVSELTSVVDTGTSVTFTFTSILNPSVSGTVGNFALYVLAPVVNTVLEEVTSMSGPVLDPNSITSIIVCPGGPSSYCIGYYPYVSLQSTQPYYLTITTTNKVPNGGVLLIQFLTSFVLRANYCLVTNGLKNQGYTEDDQILCVVDTGASTLTITKFKDFDGGVFTLTVIATTPNTSGTYFPLTVTTYYDSAMSQIIDTGVNGYITVVNIPPPQKWEVSWNVPLVVNKIVQQTVIFQSFTNGLDSSTVAFKLYFPSTFAFTGTDLGYLTPHDVFPELVVTPSISGTYIEIPSATVAQPYTNSLNFDNRFRVAGASTTDGILLPSMPGSYFVEMVTANSGTDIEATVYECIVLPDVMTGSVFSYSYDVKKKALYEVTFTPTITIPQGKVPELPQYSWGTFDIWFPTMNPNLQALWLPDLGTGLGLLDVIPCKGIQNITPVDGDNLLCRLIPADSVATYTYATVRVTNFQIIYLNVPVTIHIANVQNIETEEIPASVTIATYQITQRVYQELNQVNFTYPSTFYLNTDPSLPKINGRSPAPNGDGLNVINFLPNTVNLVTLVSFILWTESDILAGGNFYLKFPETYPLSQDSIACYINYATQLPCYTYPDSGWISILTLQYTMLNHVEYTFNIRYLQNPRHQESPAFSEAVAISAGLEIEYIYFSAFEYFDLGAVSPVNVYPSSYKANAVATEYYWIFTLTNSLPVNSRILLTFPKKDFLLNNSPAPYCEVLGEISAVDKLSEILCTISGTTIIITNFAEYTGGKEISVTIYNILNPSTARLTDYFEIETYDETDKLVDANYIISKITIESELAVGLLTYVDFYANPSNGYAIADYTISILPSRSIPAGSLISCIFPQNEFSGLGASQTCTVTGGLTTLDSCYGDTANTIVIVTDADYEKDSLSLPINITVYGLTNFQPKLTSGLLEVEISNSAVTIDTSPDSQDNRKVTMASQAGTMTLLSSSFVPVTIGERAVYNFTLQPTTAFDSSCAVVIKFPSIFARRLSEIVYCYSVEISRKKDYSVKCAVNERVLTIYDTNGWDPISTLNFTISVQHVRNPISTSTGSFIYYSQCGYEMIDYTSHAFSITSLNYPTIMYLTSGYSKGNTVLYDQESISLSAYNMYAYEMKTGDKLYVDFPIDYDLSFVGTDITGSVYFANDSFTETTSYEPNRVKINAYESTIATNTITNYTVALGNIENPAVVQTARYISLSIFTSATSEIYAKTYSNLNRNTPFAYIKQGIEVIINSLESFDINLGTSIDSISANTPSGAQTIFSILGEISDSNCEIFPNPVKFQVRDFFQYFSISCNSFAIVGEQYIRWEFEGDWPTGYWSPIQRTYFNIIDSNNDLISISDIGEVPLGGQTLPIPITLTHSPESALVIRIYTVGTLPTNVTISPEILTFTRGVTELTFRVIISEITIGLSGKLYFTKSGADSEFYTMERTILSYDIGPKDTVIPVVVEYKTLEVNRIDASFSLTVDEPCSVYWMVGRYGTRPPSIDEAISGALVDIEGLHDEPIFGSDFDYSKLASNRYQYTLDVSGLLAQTNYTLHILVKDNGGNIAKYIPTITFYTISRYRIATFPMYFTRVLTDLEIESALNKTADILGIDHSLVINRTDYSGSTGSAAEEVPYETANYTSSSGISRMLATVMSIDVLVLPMPALDIKPLDLVNSLQNYKSSLATIDGFDTSYTITGKEIYGISPIFRSTPRLGSVLGGLLTLIDLSLFNDGVINICIILYNATDYIDPISYQINNGLGLHNYVCNMSQSVDATPIPTQAFFYDILPDLEYRVMVTAENTLQVYPDFMYFVKIISFTTYGMVADNQSSARFWVVASLGIFLGGF